MKTKCGVRAIAIGIVSFGRGGLTERCIESIREVASVPYHIFIVDNGSKDEMTNALLSGWQGSDDIDVFRSDSNYGPSHGRNRILERLPTSYDAIAMLDNDVVALEGWDTAALSALDAGADLVQPKILKHDRSTVDRGPNTDNDDPVSAHPKYIGIGLHRSDPEINRMRTVNIVGCAAIIQRAVFESIGGYDESLYVGEDYDLSLRAKAAGFQLTYYPQCELIHDHAFDFDYDVERSNLRRLLGSHVRVWEKYQKAMYSPQYLAWFRWLYEHKEPMYLKRQPGIGHLCRRMRRRIKREWCFFRYSKTWHDVNELERATRSLTSCLERT